MSACKNEPEDYADLMASTPMFIMLRLIPTQFIWASFD